MSPEHEEMTEKIMRGFRLSARRLYEKGLKTNEMFVLADKNGKIFYRSAKECSERLDQAEYGFDCFDPVI